MYSDVMSQRYLFTNYARGELKQVSRHLGKITKYVAQILFCPFKEKHCLFYSFLNLVFR